MFRRILAPLGFCAAVLLLNSCATHFGGSKARPWAAAEELSIAVPFVDQGDDALCGLAAADMLTRYYNRDISPDWRRRLTAEAARSGGIRGQSLQDCLRAQGFAAAIFNGQADESQKGVFRYLKRGAPLIVMLDLDRQSIKHYVVLTGFDTKANAFKVLDPSQGARLFAADKFFEVWRRTEFFTLLAVPQIRSDP